MFLSRSVFFKQPFFTLLLLISFSTQAAPPSFISGVFAGFKNPDQRLAMVQYQAESIATWALSSAKLQGQSLGPCAYCASALFIRLEKGSGSGMFEPLPIKFFDSKPNVVAMHTQLNEQIEKPIISDFNINTSHEPAGVFDWLNNNLNESEHAILNLTITHNRPAPDGDVGGPHALNAIKVEGEVYIYDQANEFYHIPARQFFTEGIADGIKDGRPYIGFKVNYSANIGVTRVLREGRVYPVEDSMLAFGDFPSAMVDNRLLSFSEFTAEQRAVGLSYQQMMEAAARSRAVKTTACN